MSGGGTSSFYDRSSGPVKQPPTTTSSSGDAPTLDGSFLLQLLQRNPQGTPSSSSHPLLPHEGHRQYEDSAVTAIGPGLPLLPHSLLSYPHNSLAPAQTGLKFGESLRFSPPSWTPPRFSPPDVGNRHLLGAQRFFSTDQQRVGCQPSGVSPSNSIPLSSAVGPISLGSSYGGVLTSDLIGNVGGQEEPSFWGQVDRASMRNPPGFGKSSLDGSAEFNWKVEGIAPNLIGSNGPNQHRKPHSRSELRTFLYEEGMNSDSAFKMLQRSNMQNDRVERQDWKQNPEKILYQDARYTRPNGYTFYREKHAYSPSPGIPILNSCHSVGEKDGGQSDEDLEVNNVDEHIIQVLEEELHTKIEQLSFKNATSVEEDLLGKQLTEALSDSLECNKVIKHTKNLRGKDVRSDIFRGHRVSSQRARIRRREFRCRQNIDGFTSRFLHIFKSLLPSEDEITRQEQLLFSLKKLVNKEWPDAELHLYGSCANSFGVSNSDIDLCLAIKDYEISKLDILLKLADILESSNLQNVTALTHARVPIVKMMDPVTGISCDICINNLLAVVNTKLLKDYAQIDVRLRELAFIVKHWAKSRRVNETYQGTLSSYAYVLMCIHFLQTRKPAILPCLQDMPVTRRVIVDDTECAYFDQVEKLQNFGARNKESIAELLWAFFHYWAYHHDYTNDVISVRTGSIIRKHAKDWTRRIGNDRHLICIEDPFKISHDLGRVVDKFSIKILREEFERAADILQFDPNPSVTLFEPYIPGSSTEPASLA